MTGSIAENSICLALDVKCIGNSRKLRDDQIEVEADKEMIKAAKKLLDAPELDAIKSLDAEMRNWLGKRALPSMFKSGIYLIPISLVQDVDAKLQEYQENRSGKVQSFVSSYERIKADAQQRLNGVYNEKDYPSAEKVEQLFSVKSSYVTFGTPAALQQISSSLWEREKEKAEKQWKEAGEEIRIVLRESMKKLVDHMVERLASTEDGKPKIFRDSLIGNMQEFLELFNARNITGDAELEELANKAKAIMKGADPSKIRASTDTRETIKNAFESIKANLDTMVIDRPSRQIKIDDE
jgi:hypothetical protein